MDSRLGYHRLSAIGWRILLCLGAACAAVGSASSHHPITALILALAAALAAADLYAAVARPHGRLLVPSTDLVAVREADRLRALIDAVATALFVLDDRGRIVLANRAARSMVGVTIARLNDIVGLGPIALAAIHDLPAGARRVLQSEDGRHLLAWSGSFTVPGEAPQRLLSLQWIAGELDAVEVGAWHAMTRVLTHEMMNSMTPIVSLAESLAAMPGHDAGTARALATIARRGTHLLRFIERYRALGDLPQPEPVEFDLAMLLRDLIRAVDPELAEAEVDLSLRALDSPVPVTADPDLIERALINLLRNAIEASQGQPVRKIEVDLLVASTGLTVRIRDYGHGVPPAQLDNIFIPFFSTKAGGSGIGLPLARQVAALHNGTLVVKGLAEGSCFELHLPLSPKI